MRGGEFINQESTLPNQLASKHDFPTTSPVTYLTCPTTTPKNTQCNRFRKGARGSFRSSALALWQAVEPPRLRRFADDRAGRQCTGVRSNRVGVGANAWAIAWGGASVVTNKCNCHLYIY